MVVAVTGSSGFVGSRLVALLRSNNHRVIELDLTTGHDILDAGIIDTISSIDVLVHLAGMLFVPDSYKHPRQYYTVNIVGTLHALEICRKHKARLVFASSYVYGIPTYLPIDELHPVAAFNPYAQSKVIGEQLCESYWRDFRVPSTVLRPFNLYGPNQNTSFLISSILDQGKSGKIILKDPKPKRDYIFIDDVVRGFAAAVNTKFEGCEKFNLASGKSYSVREIAEFVCQALYPDAEIRYEMEERPTEVPDTIGNIRKAREVLGWEPEVGLEEGIRRCAASHAS